MSSVAVSAQDRPPENPQSTEQYLSDLNKTAFYAITRGMVPLLVTHTIFLVKFVDAWLDNQQHGGAAEAAEALMGGWPRWTRWTQRPIAAGLRSDKIPNSFPLVVTLLPYVARLLLLVPLEIGWSVLKSSWDVLRKGVRGVPPLITAVVVVFVTSDAWRILGTGFTLRFKVLVAVFLLSGLLFLVRWTCWDDVEVKDEKAAEKLLEGIGPKKLDRFNKLIAAGAGPVPIVRPLIPGTIWIYVGYWLLCAFALAVTAVFVAATLIVIGVILVSKDETKSLASSVHVYQTLPHGAVITRELLSLSFSLGAFAAFFLVAAQKPSDRKKFMRNVLRRYRRDLVVYSIYCRAHDAACDWTDVPVRARLLDHEPRPKGWLGGILRLASRHLRAKVRRGQP